MSWMIGLTRKIEGLAARTEMAYKLIAGYYRDMIQKEINLAKIKKDDHILCIGGGVCPFSAILFQQSTGAKVTVIDNNKDCTSKASKIIKRLGLENNMQVLHQDGNTPSIHFSNYTIVHIAQQVHPIESVFTNIQSQIKPGTKLLIRRPKHSPPPNHIPQTKHKITKNVGSTMLYIK